MGRSMSLAGYPREYARLEYRGGLGPYLQDRLSGVLPEMLLQRYRAQYTPEALCFQDLRHSWGPLSRWIDLFRETDCGGPLVRSYVGTTRYYQCHVVP
jgi:hypothetical protein